MEGYRHQFITLRTTSHPGPLTLVDGTPGTSDLELAARIVARYSQGRGAAQVEVEVARPDGSRESLSVEPMPPQGIPEQWYV